MSPSPDQFTGYAALTKEDGKKFAVQPWKYTPKKWSEEDIDVKVKFCGLCGSCIHTITSGWGDVSFPCIVGHEIVGEVVRAGKNQPHKIGDRVGVGAQGGSCGECRECKAGDEPYCQKGLIGTYQGKWEDGSIAQGGFADFVRTKGHFAVPIPKGLESNIAAPMLCAGVTTFTPLYEAKIGPGSKVAVVGVGGLGHFGLMFAKALGADVYALSHSASKKSDVVKMGIPECNFVVTSDEEKVVNKYKREFDFVLVTSNQDNPPLENLYIPLVKPRGTVCFVGLAEEKLPQIRAHTIVLSGVRVTGSLIGSPAIITKMLDIAVKHNIKSWIEERPMAEVGKAMKDLHDGKPRYRYVMVN